MRNILVYWSSILLGEDPEIGKDVHARPVAPNRRDGALTEFQSILLSPKISSKAVVNQSKRAVYPTVPPTTGGSCCPTELIK